MYQIIEVKDMNIEEAVALCKQEYMEEQQKTKIMPPMDREMEELLAGVIHQVKGAPYGKALIEEGKLAGFLAFFGPWEGFHGVGKGVFSPWEQVPLPEKKVEKWRRCFFRQLLRNW